MWNWRRHEQLWDKGKFILKLQTEDIYIAIENCICNIFNIPPPFLLIGFVLNLPLSTIFKHSLSSHYHNQTGALSTRMNQNLSCLSQATLQWPFHFPPVFIWVVSTAASEYNPHIAAFQARNSLSVSSLTV